MPQPRGRRPFPSVDRRALRPWPLVRGVVLVVAGLVMLAPIYWALVASFTPPRIAFRLPPRWFPAEFTVDNYQRVFDVIPFATMIFNSIKITAIVTVGSLVTSSLAAYAFARMRFPGRDLIFMVFLASLMIPGAVLVVPLFTMVRSLGLLNTHEAIYLPGLISVFGIFLLRQAFLTIPRDLEDAAKLDGAGHLRILRDIYVPLSKPTLTTHALLVSQSVWKEFFWPNIVLSDMDKMTIPVGLVFLQGSYSFEAPSVIFAGVMLVSLPLVILFFFTQRFITQGIVRAGIRG